MNRILLFFLCVVMCGLYACQKSQLYGSVQYKAQAKIDDSIVSKYIEGNHLTGKFKHVHNNDTIGVYYMVIDPGSGNTLFTNSTQVTVGDTGKLLTTGQTFYKTNDFHPSYPLGQVIRGWQLGIPEIKTGGEVRLLIPSRYAYGHYKQTDLNLPANAVLDFYIRLYNVTN
jgi:FKBP-type peptidyl-prolyl cis-trans isomerase FkpA